MKKQLKFALSGVMLVWSASALSHTAWLVPVESNAEGMAQYQVYFGGHEGKLEGYPAHKVKSINAFNKSGEKLTVWRTMDDDAMQVRAEGTPALLLMHFDNGIYARTVEGESVNVPMSEVKDALSAVNAIKYHKSIVQWADIVTKSHGQPFEVVPLSASAPKAGKKMKVKVLIEGKAAEGIEIGTGENTSETKTDENGIASYTPKKGFNKLWAGKRSDVSDNPNFTEKSVEYLLTFNAE